MQPQILEVQKKYKNDKEKQAKEILDLYKKEKINPFSGLLLAIIQLPILIALYRVFWSGLNPKELSALYSFVVKPRTHKSVIFAHNRFIKAEFSFCSFSRIMQYFQTKMMLPKSKPEGAGKSKEPDLSQVMQKQMAYFLPVFTVIILIKLPSALGLYWMISGLFSIIQQYLIFKKNNKPEPAKI